MILGRNIGRSSASKILAKAGIDESKKVQDWDDDDLGKIRQILTDAKVQY